MTVVLIVEDQRLFAEAIRDVLEKDGFIVPEIAGTGEEALRTAKECEPDLVLLDLRLPDDDGFSVGQAIMEACPDVKVVILTAMRDANMLQRSIRRGFHGYLTKDTPISQMLVSIKAVLQGQVVVPQKLAKVAAGHRTPEQQHAALLISQLSEREREVLGLLVVGSTSADIAVRLGISPNTVRTHMQNLLTKLQVHSRLEAAAFAVRHGVVDPVGPRGEPLV